MRHLFSKKYLLQNYILICSVFLSTGLLIAFLGHWTISINNDSLKRVYSFRLFSRGHFQIINANAKALYFLNLGAMHEDEENLEIGFSHLGTAKGFLLSLNSEMYLNSLERISEKYLSEYDELISSYEIILDEDLKKDNLERVNDISKRLVVISKHFGFSESEFWKKRAYDFEEIRLQNKIIEKIYWSLLTFFFLGLLILIYYSLEKRKLEVALNQQRIQNISSSRLAALGQFSAGVAHEINNPLTVILWRLKSIQKKYMNQDQFSEISKDIDSIEVNSKRIDKIIKGIKTLTKNAEKDSFEKVTVRSIKEQLEDILVPKVDLGNFKYEFISDSLESEVSMREVQIIQVLINLINNSIDAIEDLEDRWIKIESFTKDNSLIYTVTDSGNGIPKKDQAQLFKLFFTTKSVNKKGTGIGLTLSAQIIKDHQGSLSYNSSSLNTQFVIKLPLHFKSTKKSSASPIEETIII